jgi:hypothetical protein
MQPLLKLKTGLKARPVSQSLSMDTVNEFISLLLTMAALQIENPNVIEQNCYFKRNDGCLGTF